MQTDPESGLSKIEAQSRLQKIGQNRQRKEIAIKPLKIFWHQFQSSVVVLLLVAAFASMCYHEYLQAAGILAAVFVNAITGFYMEYKAGVSLASLEALAGQSVRCIRQGEQLELPVFNLVPGDLVILEAGVRVPADIRLTEAVSLSVDESPLTGESAPVFKEVQNKERENANTAFHGTLVAGGRGRGIVVKTGARTSLGKLGNLLQSTETGATPLENQLEDLGRQLSILTVVICTIVSAVGIWHKENMLLMVETGIALAVAAIPEGLPVLATLALAVGTQRMVRNRAILRHLAAVETLGCTSIICTDKTGTLTENQMTVCKLYVQDRLIEVTGSGYTPFGDFVENNKTILPLRDQVLNELMLAAAACNDATLEKGHDGEGWHVHGDPTEGALLTLADKGGIDREAFQKEMPRIAEFPFDLSRKRMCTIHQISHSEFRAFIKGAPGIMTELCSKVLSSAGEVELDKVARQKFISMNETFASQGLRVLAIARKTLSSRPACLDQEKIESEMTLIGLIASKDPPREGVREAINACKNAGIKIIMLTGDQSLTASSIASELGILEKNFAPGAVLTGKELEALQPAEALSALNKSCVLARVTPELKLSIVKTLQNANSIVAMTGDGVNDAPALKQANIGVAMGREGTDLARSVSQMVITDDNFRTIVKAIEQGRIIYGNIQRAVGYLLTASLSSVITVALGILFDLGLPLTPLQLLWLNLIMHIFPGLGIVLQKADKSVMEQAPREPGQKLIAVAQQIQICWRSALVSIAVILSVVHAEKITHAASHTTTIGLCTLSLCLLFQAWSWLGVSNLPRKLRPKTQIGFGMVMNMALAYLLLFAAIYMPGLTDILSTVPLQGFEFAYCFAISLASLLATMLLQFVIDLSFRSGQDFSAPGVEAAKIQH